MVGGQSHIWKWPGREDLGTGLVKGKRGSSQIQGLDNGGHDVINLRDDIRAMDTSKKLKE